MSSDSLKRYQEKRDFTVTSEPNPSELAEKRAEAESRLPLGKWPVSLHRIGRLQQR